MAAVPNLPTGGSTDFQKIADVFLGREGLPFADLLSADRIAEVFAKHQNLFGLRFPLERGNGYRTHQDIDESVARSLQISGDGSSGTLGDALGLQPHTDHSSRRCPCSQEASASDKLYKHLPVHPVVMDAPRGRTNER